MLQIYKASAGSGKTYRLAYEYIRALLGIKNVVSRKYHLCHPRYNNGDIEVKNRHRHILAITFTNKATEEMKRRIINEIDALSVLPSGSKDANYAERLCSEFGCSRSELAESAKKALGQLLHDYSNFNVTTIDSFFQRVLRTFARELDRQGDFNVELNDYTAVKAAVGAMIDDFNSDPKSNSFLGKWIYDYMYHKLSEGEKSNFFNRNSKLHTDLVKLVSKICDEQFKPFAAEMRIKLENPEDLAILKKEIAAKAALIPAKIKAEAEATWAQLSAHGTTLDKVGDSMKKFVSVMRDEVLAGKLISDKTWLFGAAIDKVCDNISTTLFPKKNKVPEGDSLVVAKLMKFIRKESINYIIIKDLEKNIDQLSIIGYAWRYISDLVAQNNIVLLSDTNHLLSQIIGKDETPFIYERMGVQLHHFLIDEFQDTSRMQWSNLKPLVANGLDHYDSLIIGDEKQSIYRFRNSDSSLLHRQVFEVDFPYDPFGTQVEGNLPGQNTNYRSAKEIVQFNNALFKALSALMHIEGYENVVQEIATKNCDLKGYVKLVPCVKIKKNKNDDDDSVSGILGNGINMLDLLTDNIKSQHQNGKYKWKDIAILVRKNDEGAVVVDHLLKQGIPVLSEESLFLRKSPAVQLVVGILEIIDQRQSAPRNNKNRHGNKAQIAEVISRFGYYQSINVATEDALDLAIRPSDTEELVSDLKDQIDRIIKRKTSSLTALVETIIHEMVPEQERNSQALMLSAFQDFVMDFCSRYTPTLRSLLNAWTAAKTKLSVSSGSDVDAVRVMTIHKSKGLEFDCVHIPFASWSEDGTPNSQWIEFPEIEGINPDICPPALYIDFNKNTKYYSYEGVLFHDQYMKDLHERRVDTMNLTYVAYTRAGRELFVYYLPNEGMGKIIKDALDRECLHPSPSDGDLRLCNLSDYYNTNSSEFTFGEPTVKHEVIAKDNFEMLRIESYPVHYNRGTEVLTQMDDMLDLDNDIEDSSSISPGYASSSNDKYEIADQNARERGIRLHEILSKVMYLSDIPKAVQRTRLRLRLLPNEAPELQNAVTEMLNSDDARIRRWFADTAQVLTEQSIYLPHVTSTGDRVSNDDNRRPDRIVINADQSVDIVDYKFTSEIRPSHKKQVSEYMGLLRDMGYEQIRGYLWYPFLQKIIEVEI